MIMISNFFRLEPLDCAKTLRPSVNACLHQLVSLMVNLNLNLHLLISIASISVKLNAKLCQFVPDCMNESLFGSISVNRLQIESFGNWPLRWIGDHLANLKIYSSTKNCLYQVGVFLILFFVCRQRGGSRPEFYGPKIRRYGDTEICKHSVGGGRVEDGLMW